MYLSLSFTRNKQHMLETLLAKNGSLGNDLARSQSLSRNGVSEAKTTVVANILAFIGEVHGSEKSHSVTKPLPSQFMAKASHRLQVIDRCRRNESPEILQPTGALSV